MMRWAAPGGCRNHRLEMIVFIKKSRLLEVIGMRRRALWQPSPNLNPDLVTVTMIILILTIMMQIRQKDNNANICQIPSILDLSQYNLFPPGVPAGAL